MSYNDGEEEPCYMFVKNLFKSRKKYEKKESKGKELVINYYKK